MKKYVYAAIALAVLLGTVNASTPMVYRSTSEEIIVSTAKQEYTTLNRNYFGGHLPADTEVLYQVPPTPHERALGLTDVVNGHFVIYVNPNLNVDPMIAEETVIHESCHIEEWNMAGKESDHGPHWQSCMKILANEGAFEGIW